MVNKFCPMCGSEKQWRWYVAGKKPYQWIFQCEDCGIVYEENKVVE